MNDKHYFLTLNEVKEDPNGHTVKSLCSISSGTADGAIDKLNEWWEINKKELLKEKK